MATKEVITKVWIEEGCIVCDACETTAPDVFEVLEETCIVRPAALDAEFTKPRSESIVDAAEECPTDVIKFETTTVEVADDEPAAEKIEKAKPEKAEVTASASTEPEPAISDEKPPAKAPAPKAKPAAPAVPAKVPAVAAVAKDKVAASHGPVPEPAIQALLKAAASRGGNAGIRRQSASVPEPLEALRRKDPRELPPDARHAKTLEAGGKMMEKDPDMRRRAVVGGTALAVGWTAFGVGTGLSVGPALGRFMMPNVLEEPDPRVRVGKLQRYIEMPPGGVNEDYKPLGIWMIREETRIAALSTICTHLGCIPNWLPNDHKFKCPCHGSGYKPNGINFEGPTPRPLERFRIFMDNGLVVVDKSKKYQYELGQWVLPGSFIEV